MASDHTDNGAEEKADGVTDERGLRRRAACLRESLAAKCKAQSLPPLFFGGGIALTSETSNLPLSEFPFFLPQCKPAQYSRSVSCDCDCTRFLKCSVVQAKHVDSQVTGSALTFVVTYHRIEPPKSDGITKGDMCELLTDRGSPTRDRCPRSQYHFCLDVCAPA